MSNLSFHTPAKTQSTEYEIKKSRFIAYGTKVSQRDQAMLFLNELKKQYPDARHHCWAYLIGNPYAASSAAMNDDGEPSGTAGRPILNVIQHKKIGDLMVVVVRYFGGIKLGAGGLTRAYSSAAEQLLSQLELEEHIPQQTCSVYFSFAQEHGLRHWLSQNQGQIESINYTANEVIATLTLASSKQAELILYCNAQNIRCTKDADSTTAL